MSDPEMLSPAAVIAKTYELFDPEHSVILVGTAAIHWEIMRRGGDSSSLPLNDVDGLASKQSILTVWERKDDPNVETWDAREGRVTITPTPIARKLGATVFDVMRDSNSYETPLVFTRLEERIYYNSGLLEGQIEEHQGIRYVSLPMIFWWKTAIGRPSDRQTLYRALNLMRMQSLLRPGEYYSLQDRMREGSIAEQFDGKPIRNFRLVNNDF